MIVKVVERMRATEMLAVVAAHAMLAFSAASSTTLPNVWPAPKSVSAGEISVRRCTALGLH